MNEMIPDQLPGLRIQTPCPKRWEELDGGARKRYCSECRLHVHNGAELTRAEASALVSGATERVCMRLELGPTGEPVFSDSRPAARAVATTRPGFARRAVRWAASAAVGLLAACTRSGPIPAACDPSPENPVTNGTEMMGKIRAPELMGDVAVPPPPATVQRLGEAEFTPRPAPQSPPADPAPR